MTPTQSTQLSRVAAKHGESGWIIELTPVHEKERNWSQTINPQWNCSLYLYRAFGPRKRVQLKRGMEVRTDVDFRYLVLEADDTGVVVLASGSSIYKTEASCATDYRWPNGDGTWLPIEGEPESISMEGVE